MTDAEFVFNETSKERKNVAHSASKTNRTGKGRVKLPSDNLSKREWEKLNGEVQTIDLNKRYFIGEFKRLSPLLKTEYINHLVDKYNVGTNALGLLLGCSGSTVWNSIRDCCEKEIRKASSGCSHSKQESLLRFARDYGIKELLPDEPAPVVNEAGETEEVKTEEIEEVKTVEVAEDKEEKAGIDEIHISMDGLDMSKLIKVFELVDINNIYIDISIRRKRND